MKLKTRHVSFVILVLIGCLVQCIQSQEVIISDVECFGLDNGTSIKIGRCLDCLCIDGVPQCTPEKCPPTFCHPSLLRRWGDGCCPTCSGTGCYDDQLGFGSIERYRRTDTRYCEGCECDWNSELRCHTSYCPPCRGNRTFWGNMCCRQCDVHECLVNGIVYQIGENIPTDDPCKTSCSCVLVEGESLEVQCEMVTCEYCPGVIKKDDGSCCGICIVDTCIYNRVQYLPGDDIPTDDLCNSCSCIDDGESVEMKCSRITCTKCIGEHIPDETCCGKCTPLDVCFVDGKSYPVGIEVPATDPCQECSCMIGHDGRPDVICMWNGCTQCHPGYDRKTDGITCCGKCVLAEEDCATVVCMALSCPEEMQYQQEGRCCPECKCRYNGRIRNPGPVGRRCSGCVCINGEVTCIPSVCPKKNIECVDAVLGEDCCFHCPNGKTCSYGPRSNKVVLNYGEYSFINDSIVACYGNPWFPVAFSVRERVPRHVRRLIRNYREQAGDYMQAP